MEFVTLRKSFKKTQAEVAKDLVEKIEVPEIFRIGNHSCTVNMTKAAPATAVLRILPSSFLTAAYLRDIMFDQFSHLPPNKAITA